MKRITVVLAMLTLLAGLVFAEAAINGKWVSERKVDRDGQSFTIIQTFDLKADGPKLTGKATMKFGDMEPREMDIQDGKITGDKVSWTTTMQTPNGDFKMLYTATVTGDSLKGEVARDGGDARPFEAKRK